MRPNAKVWPLRAATLVLSTVLLSGCVFITGNFNPFSAAPESLEEYVVDGEGRDKVLLIDVSRTISSQGEGGTLGIQREESVTARVLAELNRARKDEAVRAVVLRINSPGGTVTASDTVYHEVLRFKQDRNVPVLVQMLDMATSGAFYVSLAADEIVASPTTVTGSVGVIMYGVNLSGLMQMVGVKNQTLKTGALKDAGSPLRPMTGEDAQLLQGLLTQMQERFLGIVRTRRPAATEETLQTIADGRVLTADQALQDRLVDRIGYIEDTVQLAKQRAGISEAQIIMYRRSHEFSESIYSRAPSRAPQVNLMNVDLGMFAAAPQFMYLWLPMLD